MDIERRACMTIHALIIMSVIAITSIKLHINVFSGNKRAYISPRLSNYLHSKIILLFFNYLTISTLSHRLDINQVTYKAKLKFLIKLIGQSSSLLDRWHLLPGYAKIRYALQGFRWEDFLSAYWSTVFTVGMFLPVTIYSHICGFLQFC